MNEILKARIQLIGSMLIFGSVGLFVRQIALPSGSIAFSRGIIGSLFLLSILFLQKRKISVNAIKKNLLLLVLSGSAVGLNWIFLFEAYHYTSISKATLSYYFAPIFVILLSPIILKEKLTIKKFICAVIALIGLILVINMKAYNLGEILASKELVGIIYGLLAAALYASVMLMNKFLKGISGLEITITQLIMVVIVLCPYVILKEGFSVSNIEINSVLSMVILGVIHTGVAYFMYFSAMQHLKSHTIAIFSYIDPIAAIILAAIILGEGMNIVQIIGSIFILGSAAIISRSKE
jgi:RarD protein